MSDEMNPYEAPAAGTLQDMERQQQPNQLVLASRWSRLGAAIIDGIILTLVLLVFMLPLGYLWASSVGITNWDSENFVALSNQMNGLGFQLAAGAVSLLLSVLIYAAVNWVFLPKGQTVGKRICGIRMVLLATGEVPSLKNLVWVRYALLQLINSVPMIGGVFSLVDVLFIFFDPHRQCLHDKMAKTTVVEA